jgi:3-deoxy-D-manno-octulosonic-acid transferase
MTVFYDLVFLLFSIVYLPAAWVRGKLRWSLMSRMGKVPAGTALDKPVWIHAVSVGEAMAIKHLVGELRQSIPGKKFVITTVTETGNRIASTIAGPADHVCYLPLDFSWMVRRAVRALDPALLVLTETEFWPNLITCLARRGIPIIVVNGRVSDRSFGRYRSFAFLVRPILRKISLFCVQTPLDAERLKALGVRDAAIRVTGNMKFDVQVRDYTELRKDYTDYRQRFGLTGKERLWVAASTHAGEEEIIVSAYKRLRQDFPFLRLLIAPRHPERSGQVEQCLTSAGLTPQRISKLSTVIEEDKRQKELPDREAVFILDTIGQLMYFYAIADLVFVGGSLVKTGGHNILEPASLGKAVITGPHMFNFRDIAALFSARRGCVTVSDAFQLEDELRQLLADEKKAEALGIRAREAICGNQGATLRNRQAIEELLKK